MSDYSSGYDPKYGYNRNAFAHKTVGTAIMGRVVKVIVTPIGLVSEAIHARRDKRRPSGTANQEGGSEFPSALDSKTANMSGSDQVARKDSAYVEVPPEMADELIANGQAEPADREAPTHELVVEDEGIGCDEADWALDEAAAEGEEKEPASNDEKGNEKPKEGAPAANSAAPKESTQKLPFPVILPQRRPGTKARGFVRAFAPILEESGVSQDAFLRFLKDFHRAAQASPIFDVVMIATAIAAACPDPVIGLGIQAVQEKMKQFRIASGETHGEAEMPVTCAPLVFPALDIAAAASPAANEGPTSEGIGRNIKAKSRSASKFVNDYFDRRAQASYAYQNPDSTLTAQAAPLAPKFKSRFADPNNATNTHLFTLITGGRYKAEPLGARRRYERAQRKAAEKTAQGLKQKPSKRLLRENVLYLMVVNMPTGEELVKAKREMQEAKEKKTVSRKQQA